MRGDVTLIKFSVVLTAEVDDLFRLIRYSTIYSLFS